MTLIEKADSINDFMISSGWGQIHDSHDGFQRNNAPYLTAAQGFQLSGKEKGWNPWNTESCVPRDFIIIAIPKTFLLTQQPIREVSTASRDNLRAVSLFARTGPSLCRPSLVTEAMAHAVEERTGVPVVSITCDGTGGDKDRKIIPYLVL